MALTIVGYNLSHDSSACLVQDGRVVSALALERTTVVKRGVVPPHAYAAAMSRLTRDLLHDQQLRPADVDHWIATSTESRDELDEAHLLDSIGLLADPGQVLHLPHPGHHLAHACAAFFTSGLPDAGALVIDAYGSRAAGGRERESAFSFDGSGHPRLLWRSTRAGDRIAGLPELGAGTRQLSLPTDLSGIGEVYRTVTLALGFAEPGSTYDDAGKTMGLASYGKRLSARSLFIHVDGLQLSFEGAPESLVDLGLATRQGDGFHLLPRQPGDPLTQLHCDVAAQVQAEFEQACLTLAVKVLQDSGSRNLVASGGCFLNSMLNARIAQELDLDTFFPFPASTDDGNAIGAALYAHHVLLDAGDRSAPHSSRAGARPPHAAAEAPAPPSAEAGIESCAERPAESGTDIKSMGGAPDVVRGGLRHVLLGPSRLGDGQNGKDGSATAGMARLWRLPSVVHPSSRTVARAAAAAIARGEIVAWFQDRAEFGPRALGARSILCHPGLPGMKDKLNSRVKYRESFRPFAASVLADHASKWFVLPGQDSPFMMMAFPVRADRAEAVREITHVDGTCRLQTVDSDYPGAFRTLLEEFERLTGLPMVLNTSLNVRGKPIVELPEQAIEALYVSRLDRAFVGTCEISGPDLGNLRPTAVLSGSDDQPRPCTTGGQQPESQFLSLADGRRTLHQVCELLDIEPSAGIDLALDLHRRRRLLWEGIPQFTGSRLPLPQYAPASGGTW